MEKRFIKVSANPENPKWNVMIHRENELYRRNNELRSEFQRDYTRVLFSNAYKRLKNKTQVFFSPTNDHVSTRIQHVNYVESISYTIAKSLGLNTELTKAIAVAHDLGHSPFGHAGEKILSKIAQEDIDGTFWHEKNGLMLVDYFELLDDEQGKKRNLNLTYAVRDGIISHCGEVDEERIKPRNEAIDLKDYLKPNQYQAFTWEGCVVKIADKISYIGRDIEDAVTLELLDRSDVSELKKILEIDNSDKELNNTNIINDLIYDIVVNSNPETGIQFSKEKLNLLNKIKQFNYEKIYAHPKIKLAEEYFKLVLQTIYYTLKKLYNEETKIIDKQRQLKNGRVIEDFLEWAVIYFQEDDVKNISLENPIEFQEYRNKKVFDIKDPKDYYRAVLEYISGMTDKKAMDTYREIISF